MKTRIAILVSACMLFTYASYGQRYDTVYTRKIQMREDTSEIKFLDASGNEVGELTLEAALSLSRETADAGGPVLNFSKSRSNTPLVNDIGLYANVYVENTGSVLKQIGTIIIDATNVTPGSEDGRIRIYVAVDGTAAASANPILTLNGDDESVQIGKIKATGATDIVMKMGDEGGTNAVSFQDSAGNEVWFADSDGGGIADGHWRFGSNYVGDPQAPVHAMTGTGIGATWSNIPNYVTGIFESSADNWILLGLNPTNDGGFLVDNDGDLSTLDGKFWFDDNTEDAWLFEIAETQVLKVDASGDVTLQDGAFVGIGDTAERIVFDGTGNEIEIHDTDFLFNPDGDSGVELIIYGDTATIFQTDSANNRLGIGGAPTAYLFEVLGTMAVTDKIYHVLDTNTFVEFLGDIVNIQCGGILMARYYETAQPVIEFNPGLVDVDTIISSDITQYALMVQGSDSFVGVGTGTPAALVEIETISSLGVEALQIDQNDEDKAFIDYAGATAADTSKNISTLSAGSESGSTDVAGPDVTDFVFAGMVRTEVLGVEAWMPYFEIAP